MLPGLRLEQDDLDRVNDPVPGAEKGHPFLAASPWLTARAFEHSRRIPRPPAVATQSPRTMGPREHGRRELRHVEGEPGTATTDPAAHFRPYAWHDELPEDRLSDDTHSVHHRERSGW